MRKYLVLGILILAVFAVGCGKGPAAAALKAAEDEIANVQPALEKYAPEQVGELTKALDEANKQFNQKNYKEALTAAQAIPPKAKDAMAAATAKKEELTGRWNELQAVIPVEMQELKTKVDALAGFRRLPKGIDQAGFDTAKASMAESGEAFDAATAAYGEGELADAVTKAMAAKGKADEAAKLLESIQVTK